MSDDKKCGTTECKLYTTGTQDNCGKCVEGRRVELCMSYTEAPRAQDSSGSAGFNCYNAEEGRRKYENAGWCEYKGKCKDKHRVYEEGPRGGMRRTENFMCQGAL